MSTRTGLACLSLAACLLGQGSERLSLEALAHPTLKQTYVGTPATRLEWLPDGALMQTRREGDKVTLLRVDAMTGEAKPLLEADRLLVAAGRRRPGDRRPSRPGPGQLHLERRSWRAPALRGR